MFHGQTSVPTPRPRVIEASKAMLAAAKVMAIPVIVTVRHRRDGGLSENVGYIPNEIAI